MCFPRRSFLRSWVGRKKGVGGLPAGCSASHSRKRGVAGRNAIFFSPLAGVLELKRQRFAHGGRPPLLLSTLLTRLKFSPLPSLADSLPRTIIASTAGSHARVYHCDRACWPRALLRSRVRQPRDGVVELACFQCARGVCLNGPLSRRHDGGRAKTMALGFFFFFLLALVRVGHCCQSRHRLVWNLASGVVFTGWQWLRWYGRGVIWKPGGVGRPCQTRPCEKKKKETIQWWGTVFPHDGYL